MHGTFNFTVTDAAEAHLLVSACIAGQCSEPIQVAAGVNPIVEHGTGNTVLTDVDAFPEDRLLTVNLINRTATVEVPVSDSPNDETQVYFYNELLRGQLKLCKALGPGSADLIGQKFELRATTSPTRSTRSCSTRQITAAATTQCKIYGFLPIGLPIKVDELFAKLDNADTW